jgi:hypothetical protein
MMDEIHDKPYPIEPKNMEKRVRVFVNQLLPGMLKGLKTTEEAWFMRQVLSRQCKRFLRKLNKIHQVTVNLAVDDWIAKWQVILVEIEARQEEESTEIETTKPIPVVVEKLYSAIYNFLDKLKQTFEIWT